MSESKRTADPSTRFAPLIRPYMEALNSVGGPRIDWTAYKSVAQQAMEEITGYRNGCPIIPESND